MLNNRYAEAVYGMLCLYGTISINEIFIISYKCGLCDPSDYKVCMDIIGYNIIKGKKAYFKKNRLCHSLLKNESIVKDMQDELCLSSYKMYTADEYILIGTTETRDTKEVKLFISYLRSRSSLSVHAIENEVLRIWTELNNIGDLVVLTEECIDNLDLYFDSEKNCFNEVFIEINKLANSMPRWFCKGYSYSEVVKCYDC